MTAPNVEAPGPAVGVAGQAQGDISADILAAAEAERKAFDKAAALAALAGCTLHQLSSGGYLLGRWAFCRELPDLRAVHAVLAQIGGRT